MLCFPYIFRGALDCGATKITEAMKLACVREIAALAKAEISDEVAEAYAGQELRFGPDYIIPTPFDSRLILRIAPAVAKAAAESGRGHAADRRPRRLPPEPDPVRLSNRHADAAGVRAPPRPNPPVWCTPKARTNACCARCRWCSTRAWQAHPGGPARGGRRCASSAQSLRLTAGRDFQLVDPENDPRFREYWELYAQLMGRDGITPEAAKAAVRRSTTLISALMLHRGEADAMLVRTGGPLRPPPRARAQRDRPGARRAHARHRERADAAAAHAVPHRHLRQRGAERASWPTSRITAAGAMQRFGMPPRVAFLSHSVFGRSQRASARRMRAARDLFVRAHRTSVRRRDAG